METATKKEEREFSYKNNAKHVAFKDMIEYIEQNNLRNHLTGNEIWYYSPWKLSNKQTTRLNRQLGIHKINKTWECQKDKFKNRLKA